MNVLKGDVVYNKFLTQKIEVKIKGVIIERLLDGCEIFIKYLKEELPHTINPALRDDIERMTRVVEGLSQLGDTHKGEGSIEMTISEFLIFRYGLECVAGLVVSLNLSDSLSIEYMDFMIYLEEIYENLNENDINSYYSFISTYDAPQVRMLN